MSERRPWFAVPRDLADPDHPLRAHRPLCLWACLVDLWGLAVFKHVERFTEAAGLVVQEPGEVLASHSYLSRRWNMSEKKVRTTLNRLEKSRNLVRRTVTQSGTIYAVAGYGDVQPNGHPGGHPDGQAEGTPGADRGPTEGRPRADRGREKNTAVPAAHAVTLKTRQKQVKDVSPDQPATNEPSWVQDAMTLYESEIGMLPFGRLGKALKPAVTRYGWGGRHDNQVHEWWNAYCRHKPLMRANGTTPDVIGKGEPLIRNTQFCSPEDFVKNLTFWRDSCTLPAPDPNIVDARRLVAP